MNLAEIESLEKQIIDGYIISPEQGLDLIKNTPKELFYKLADNLRKHFQSNNFDTCSIINARSGKCSEDCKWCSQSKFYHTAINTYPLISSKEAIEMAVNNRSKGVGKFSLVTSGRAMSSSEVERACEIYEDIKKSCDIKLCASMGLLAKDDMQQLFDAGVEFYHCNLECAPSLFKNLCTTHTIEDKLKTIGFAREVGMKVCSGGIIGMGESVEQRIEFALTLRAANVDSIPVNILNPIKGTPLQDSTALTEEDILDSCAIFRVVNPKAYIRFAGGRGGLTIEGQKRAFKAGVNGALVGDLLTTVGSNDINSDMKLIESEGYVVNYK